MDEPGGDRGRPAVIGLAFASGRRQLVRPAIIGFTLLCLADWVLIQDLGFFGGLGTDPNSMIPFVLLADAGYLALARVRPALRSPLHPPWWRGHLHPVAVRAAARGPAAAVRDHLVPGGCRRARRQSASSQAGRGGAASGIIRGW